MHELEQLLARVAVPQPSAGLDERIDALLSPPLMPRPPAAPRASRQTLLATAACVGALGFFLGRWSAGGPAAEQHSPAPPPAVASAPARQQPAAPAAAPYVQRVPLRDDQLAGMFVRSTGREGLLGRGPITIEVSQSP